MRLSDTSFGATTRPWYRLEPGSAVVVAVCLFVGVTVAQWFSDGSGQAIAVLYILPISLMAVTFGVRGGLTAASMGFALFALFEIVHSSGDIDVDGWAVRAAAMFLLGGLLGSATD
jgi:glucose-6-phosphate-specific signal transduction histidine kinase